ncbi:YpmS family protein [Bacillus fonticola]|uniref:YpmS family protein n=1 Tax=Bacillus fonticola TaxID=2728853 RepID=UPI001473AAAE|nr:YpmS family protein [Bacillus fonticola]
MKNKAWKRGFFLLLGLLLSVVIMLSVLIFMPVGEPTEQERASGNSSEGALSQYAQVNAQVTKQDLSAIVNDYIEEQNVNGPISYWLTFSDTVNLNGSLAVFGTEIELQMAFSPLVQENGDVLLRQESISIGQLQLPVDYVLKYIRDSYQFPEWVEILPNQERVYVDLDGLTLQSGAKVKLSSFDLADDDIRFTLYIPRNS